MYILGVKRNAVHLEPHNKHWATLFQETKTEIQHILGSNLIDIQHIGSTAIKNIVAKPILDVAVVVTDTNAIDLNCMKNYDYIYRGDAGVPGRCFFAKYRDEDLSTHHIHCYNPSNQNFLANIAFRDYLNMHSDFATQYSELKLRLAKQYANNRLKYTKEKTAFIKMVLKLSHF